ncbi:MAG: phenylalanine--tRNA ligase beta subunit-related protein [Candidatus Paceibacterota bacterium]|jgi:phenylalanyl-tRNA synthetase beta subunit|nr:phenylalanine--tRNA ligase beta subunit-related protein [Candidatus Paceibacterota bacterium]
MKISHAWLSEYFKKPLPPAEQLADIITFHAFEVEGIEKTENGPVIDIAILPNRSHDCLSYAGMAEEIGTILGKKVMPRKLKKPKKGNTRKLIITLEDEKLCRRYTGQFAEDIAVGPSPEYLKKHLESVGQRSINNVVDIMNFVMFETGQPLHAFDADKLTSTTNSAHLIVRKAKEGELLRTLDGKDIALNENILVIADDQDPIAIAGIKGGKKAEVNGDTKNIIIESANFSPSNIRKTSRSIGIRTDASIRFENEITPEKTKFAIEYAVSLLGEHAAGPNFHAGKIIDSYPRAMNPFKVGISVSELNKILGTSFTEAKAESILKKFHFDHKIVLPREEIEKNAITLAGAPYVRGASISYDAPKAFDCSSFVGYLYAQAGFSLPRISADMFVFVPKVSESEAKQGDIIFSNTGEGNIFYETAEFLKGTKIPEGIDHCGIFLGDGKVIHATKGKGVVIEDLSGNEKFKTVVGYGRLAGMDEDRFVVTIPAERIDLRRKEDLAEEIGRVYGYEKVVSEKPVMEGFTPEMNKTLYYGDVIRGMLTKEGFSEISTYAFTEKGEIEVENPIASDKKYLRNTLTGNMEKALELNVRNAPLLGLSQIKLFEIGKVFAGEKEYISLCLGVDLYGKIKNKEDEIKNILFSAEEKLADALGTTMLGKTWNSSIIHFDLETILGKLKDLSVSEKAAHGAPASSDHAEKRYEKISIYPFMLRDIAVFVPEGVEEEDVSLTIKTEATDLLVRATRFDVFTKTFEDGTKKTSYAFRLVFQSQEKTLSDEEINAIMDKITAKLNEREEWKVR